MSPLRMSVASHLTVVGGPAPEATVISGILEAGQKHGVQGQGAEQSSTAHFALSLPEPPRQHGALSLPAF